MKIGFAGMGRMGAAMALRLLELGHEVTVWNRSADKLGPLVDAGARTAPTPAALVPGNEVIITSLLDGDALRDVFEGADGLLSADLSGRLVIEMSTVLTREEEALAQKVKAAGAAFCECPVGGTTVSGPHGQAARPQWAARRKMQSGRALCRDLLCRRVEHVGPNGAGAALKLAINLPCWCITRRWAKPTRSAARRGSIPTGWWEFLADTSAEG